MIKYFPLLLIACLLLAASGCVTKTDMETLQIERQQDVSRIQQLEAELAESKRLLRQEIEKSQSPVREKTADTWAELQSLRADFARLRGELETLNMRLDRQVGEDNATMTMAGLHEQIQEIEFILENQLQVDLGKLRADRGTATGAAPFVAAPEGGVSTVTVGSPAKAEDVSAEPADAPAQPGDAAKALYDKAYALYKEGEFEKARSYWAEFTDTFKQHAYVPSAVFWQGQCYYKLQDYARAVILYEDVIDKYSKSSKYIGALLMSAYSWERLGKPELAKMRFGEVVKKFPDSPQATQARRALEKMK
ncbi:MAG: tetratricopeptide repeat protein [Pseudodesulfovibrio sp.]